MGPSTVRLQSSRSAHPVAAASSERGGGRPGARRDHRGSRLGVTTNPVNDLGL